MNSIAVTKNMHDNADACIASIMADGGCNSSLRLPCVFSPKSRQYLASFAQDGRLRIWNTDSKILHQEYVPSAHLSATCTCIVWGPCRIAKEGPRRKKRKSEAGHVEDLADLLALGTVAGSIIIYSAVKGALHCTLDGGHNGGVNCVEWHPEDGLLYSGSDDSYIVEWDLQTSKTRCKWKADRASVTSLCVSPDGKLLLSAGQTIKMWDLKTKEVYRKFTGHSTAVTNLRFATTRPPDSNERTAIMLSSVDPLYTGAVRLAVVCKDGQLHLFEHFLNGPCKKPLSPSCTVQMSGLEDIPVPVPLLAAALTADTRSLLLAYGSYLQPVMERLDVNTAERHVCLTRNVHTTLAIAMETTVSKVKTPVVNAKSKVLVPGLPGHQAPVKAALGSEKRKKGTDTKEMSIEERLGEIDLSREKGGVKETPSLQTDNFAVLLVQGLESKDANILNNVFQTRKDNLIKKTVSRLPIPAVLPLVEELTKRMQGHPYTAVLMVRWLKAVLMQHTSYLSSLPDLVSQLGVLYHMIESRVKMFHKLTKLHGKLYLLMTQVRLGTSCFHSTVNSSATTKNSTRETRSREKPTLCLNNHTNVVYITYLMSIYS
uniref:Small-subunit processome Utp12 domain-containing protein n=1 Tax=Oncorhynchus mykiss TaxID=8022 RepID=A0A8C7S566_ONCMY